MTDTISLLLVDDQQLIRLGFRMVLEAEADMVVVGEAADGHAAIAQSAALRPDVVLMDIRMPGLDGIAATEAIVRERPETRVLVLTTWSAVLGLLLAAPVAAFEWQWQTWPDLALLSIMGVAGLVAQSCYIKGMAIGDTTAMAPIDYSRLLFALIVGFVLFQDVPDPLAMVGAAIVIASTLFITFREARLKLPKRPPSDQ